MTEKAFCLNGEELKSVVDVIGSYKRSEALKKALTELRDERAAGVDVEEDAITEAREEWQKEEALFTNGYKKVTASAQVAIIDLIKRYQEATT